jgi:arylsulfatase A
MKEMYSKCICVLVLSLFAGFHAKSQQQPPNIVFILADDLGWSSLSVPMDPRDPRSGSDYHETPNLARLAAEGMRLTRGYAPAAICSPSRRSILFGHTPARQGNGESFPQRYHPSTTGYVTLPQMFRQVDPRYKTAHYGKWDMRAGFSPEDAGYDESDGDTGNRHGDVISDKAERFNALFVQQDPKRAFTIADRAVNFMERQVRGGNPFYLQLSHYATHVDVQGRPETLKKYESKEKGKKHGHHGFAAMLEDLDTSIGIVLNKIEELGIADNTYVIFMADNGATEFFPPVKNRLDHPDKFADPMRNHPLRGGKWTLYEGGVRVPFIVRGPGIASSSYVETPVVGWDLLPTFRELVGGTSPSGEVTDGWSFASLLRGGKTSAALDQRALYFHRYNNSYPHSAVMQGNFKLIKFWKTGKVELYNLADDPGELNDLAAKNTARARALEKLLVTYLETVNPEILSMYKKS